MVIQTSLNSIQYFFPKVCVGVNDLVLRSLFWSHSLLLIRVKILSDFKERVYVFFVIIKFLATSLKEDSVVTGVL